MRLTKIVALPVFAAAVLLGSGCGGGGGDGLAKAELAKRADAICVKYNKKIDAIAAPKNDAGLPAYFAKVVPLTQDAGRELKALKPADDVKATWIGLMKDYDALVATSEKAADALKAKQQKEYEKLSGQLAVQNAASNKKLDAFGALDCGSKADA